MKRLLLVLLAACLPAMATDTTLTVGAAGDYNPANGSSDPNLDASYRHGAFGVSSSFQRKDIWAISMHEYLLRYLFFTESFHYNRITTSTKRAEEHPPVLQEGIGLHGYYRRFGVESSISYSVRPETLQHGYAFNMRTFTDLGHNCSADISYTRSRLLQEKEQIGIGIAYRFEWKK